MQARIAGGEDAAALSRIAAVPGRDHAAGALDDRDQRQDVEILEPGLDHEVDLAEREQAIIVAVAAEASQTNGLGDAREARPLLLGLEQIGARGGSSASLKTSARTGADGLLHAARVAEVALRLPAPEALAGEGLVHEAEQRCAVPEEADKGAPQRLADDEGAGAVDRIDDPAIVGLGPARAELLADDAVRRMGVGDRLSDGGLGGNVRGGDRIEQGAALVVNGEA